MNGKTCVVTGANSGIGKETALALSGLGAHVVIVDIVRAEETAAEIYERNPEATADLLVADLSSLDEVRRIADEILRDHPEIDVLINNAGRHLVRRETSVDGFEMNFALNCLAPFLLTQLLLPALEAAAPARVVNVASEAHRVPGRFEFDDLNTERESMFYAYGKSKIANIMWMKAMARRLEGTGVSINAVCPGLVATNIFDNYFPLWFSSIAPHLADMHIMSSARDGAQMQIRLASEPEFAGVSGKFFTSHPLLKLLPEQKQTLSVSQQERVWDTVSALTGVAA